MKSLVVKRSVVIDGHKTSVSLEDAFWSNLKDIADTQHVTLSEVVTKIDKGRRAGNLSSAIRLFVFDQVRTHGNLWRYSSLSRRSRKVSRASATEWTNKRGTQFLASQHFLKQPFWPFVGLMRHGLLCDLVWMISVISPVTGSILRTGEPHRMIHLDAASPFCIRQPLSTDSAAMPVSSCSSASVPSWERAAHQKFFPSSSAPDMLRSFPLGWPSLLPCSGQ